MRVALSTLLIGVTAGVVSAQSPTPPADFPEDRIAASLAKGDFAAADAALAAIRARGRLEKDCTDALYRSFHRLALRPGVREAVDG